MKAANPRPTASGLSLRRFCRRSADGQLSATARQKPPDGPRPIADVHPKQHTHAVIWWNWKIGQRLALIGFMLSIAAIPWLLIGKLTSDWRGMIGGTALFFIPLMMAWLLFVGLRTGRMPSAYGRSELRSEAPRWVLGDGSGLRELVAPIFLPDCRGRVARLLVSANHPLRRFDATGMCTACVV